MEIATKVIFWIFGIFFTVFICFVIYVLYRDIRDAIEDKNKKKLYQWMGMLAICIIAFVLCRTVFQEQINNLSTILRGSPVVTLGDNVSIKWEKVPETKRVIDNITSIDDLFRMMDN